MSRVDGVFHFLGDKNGFTPFQELGHEVLTRLGILICVLEEGLTLNNWGIFGNSENFDVRGSLSRNSIVRGNFLTDVPKDFQNAEINLIEYYTKKFLFKKIPIGIMILSYNFYML